MTTPRRPPGRYDEPRALPKPVLYALVGVLGVVLLAVLFVSWQRFESKDKTYTLIGYQVLSDVSVEIRFLVPLTPGTTVRCELRAHDSAGAEVGRETVKVGPQQTSPAVVAHVLATTRRAATGEVTGCSP